MTDASWALLHGCVCNRWLHRACGGRTVGAFRRPTSAVAPPVQPLLEVAVVYAGELNRAAVLCVPAWAAERRRRRPAVARTHTRLRQHLRRIQLCTPPRRHRARTAR